MDFTFEDLRAYMRKVMERTPDRWDPCLNFDLPDGRPDAVAAAARRLWGLHVIADGRTEGIGRQAADIAAARAGIAALEVPDAPPKVVVPDSINADWAEWWNVAAAEIGSDAFESAAATPPGSTEREQLVGTVWVALWDLPAAGIHGNNDENVLVEIAGMATRDAILNADTATEMVDQIAAADIGATYSSTMTYTRRADDLAAMVTAIDTAWAAATSAGLGVHAAGFASQNREPMAFRLAAGIASLNRSRTANVRHHARLIGCTPAPSGYDDFDARIVFARWGGTGRRTVEVGEFVVHVTCAGFITDAKYDRAPALAAIVTGDPHPVDGRPGRFAWSTYVASTPPSDTDNGTAQRAPALPMTSLFDPQLGFEREWGRNGYFDLFEDGEFGAPIDGDDMAHVLADLQAVVGWDSFPDWNADVVFGV